MQKTLNLVCEPFEAGRSGISRYMQSVYESLERQAAGRSFKIQIYTQDPAFKKMFPGARFADSKKFAPGSVTHFLSERRVWPVSGPSVITCHDLTPQTWPYRYGYLRAVYHKTYVNYFLRRAGAVVAPSEATRSDLILKSGVEPASAVVVRHGLRKETFFPERGARPDLPALSSGNKFMLIVSRLEHPGKNLVFAIQAYNRLRESSSETVELLLAGAPWNGYDTIQAEIARSPFAKNIHHVAGANDALLRQLYSHAEFLFFAGLREGFALPVIESLACGTPVLLGKVGVLEEFSGEKGLVYFDPKSVEDCATKMQGLLSSPSVRSQVRLDLAYWSWDRVATELFELYAKLQ